MRSSDHIPKVLGEEMSAPNLKSLCLLITPSKYTHMAMTNNYAISTLGLDIFIPKKTTQLWDRLLTKKLIIPNFDYIQIYIKTVT